tara:strand:+ start:191 stop:382 length:192 start_codon:yes stop_codon:yes gene_type:complete
VDMRDKILQIIENLNNILNDVEKVEEHAYGYKAAAVRARKVLHESRKEFQELRKEIQERKNEE